MDIEDVAFITVYFPRHVIAHINVNWLSPVKVRTTLIGGEKKMLVWNDLEADEKIKVYDKGVSMSNPGRLAPVAGQLSLGRHVGAAGGADRSAARGNCLFPEMHRRKTRARSTTASPVCGSSRMLEAADRSVRNRGEAVTL